MKSEGNIVLVIIAMIIMAIWNVITSPIFLIALLVGLVLFIICVFIKVQEEKVSKKLQAIQEQEDKENEERKHLERKEAEREFLKQIAETNTSLNRHDYIINNNDYKRGTEFERAYIKEYKLRLLGLFDNKCANCGRDNNGMDIDHFIFSKNEGGCFFMRHKEGYFINNAIPLCETCNRSKSDASPSAFFSNEKLLEILEKNKVMTQLLNRVALLNLPNPENEEE